MTHYLYRRSAISNRLELCSVLCLALACTSHSATTVAQQVSESTRRDVQSIEPFVSETTVLVLKVDSKQIKIPLQPESGVPNNAEQKATLGEVLRQFATGLSSLQALTDEQPFYASIGIPVSSTDISFTAWRRKTTDDNAKLVITQLKKDFQLDAVLNGSYIVARPAVKNPVVHSKAPESTLVAMAEAFSAVADFPVQLLFMPPEHVWRTIRELSPNLPAELGGGPSSVLTEGVRWVSIGVNPERWQIEVTIQSADAKAAHEFAAYLPKLLRSAYGLAKPLDSYVTRQIGTSIIDSLKPNVVGNRVVLHWNGIDDSSSIVTMLSGVLRSTELEVQSREKVDSLRQILLAMHHYLDANKSFPLASRHVGKDGKALLSWRVYLLPYLGQEPLFNQFHLDEPWDSPHNKTLLPLMPDVYAGSDKRLLGRSTQNPGHTTFLAPIGENTIFGGTKATKLEHITDGTSNTIAVVEVIPELAVPWTAPQDYAYEPERPLAGIFVPQGRDAWLAAFADGSVRWLKKDIPNATVRFLFQISDGNVINID